MEEDEEQVSEGSREWDPIHYPHHHLHSHHSSQQTHYRSPSDSQTQFKAWSMVAIKDSHFTNDDNGSIVFPPINHEGLHLSSRPSPSLSRHNDNQHEVRKSSCEENGLLVPLQPSDTGSLGGREVARWVGIGFELLRSRVTCFVSLLLDYARFGGTNWSFSPTARVAVAVLIWWLYAVVRRRRRNSRIRKESRDHLILIIKEKDEKINQLLNQIAQLNQLLLALHRDSLPGIGEVTK